MSRASPHQIVTPWWDRAIFNGMHMMTSRLIGQNSDLQLQGGVLIRQQEQVVIYRLALPIQRIQCKRDDGGA